MLGTSSVPLPSLVHRAERTRVATASAQAQAAPDMSQLSAPQEAAHRQAHACAHAYMYTHTCTHSPHSIFHLSLSRHHRCLVQAHLCQGVAGR